MAQGVPFPTIRRLVAESVNFAARTDANGARTGRDRRESPPPPSLERPVRLLSGSRRILGAALGQPAEPRRD